MSVLLILARVLTSAVFMVAGFAKFADPAGSRKAAQDFGVPNLLTGFTAVFLPVIELAVAVALLPARFAWYGAVGAIGLYMMFIAAIVITLARGHRPDCHCFGQLHSKPIGPGIIARNVALTLPPALVASNGLSQPSIPVWLDKATAGQQLWFILAAAAVVIMLAHCWVSLQLARQGGRVLLRLDELEKRQTRTASSDPLPASPNPPQGLPVGAEAPPFSLTSLAGTRVSLSDLIAGLKPAVLLFVHPDCGPCRSLLKEAPEWQRSAEGRFRLAVISQGSRKENLAKITRLQLEHFLLQENREVSEAYKTIATPGAVLVSHDGKIALPAAFGAEAIRSLIATIINASTAALAPTSMNERDPVPRLVYPDLDGKMRLLAEVVDGERSLLLFWNTACGFCRQMLPDLKAWEREPAKERRRIVLISTGSVQQNRDMGLKCPILIDSGFTLGRAFGASGTPSAVLVDAEARIASKLAVGREEILALTLKHVSKTAAT